MDEFTLTCYNLDKSGYYYNSDRDQIINSISEVEKLGEFLRRYAYQNNLKHEIRINSERSILKITVSEISFVIVFLRVLEKYFRGMVSDKNRDVHYFLGNTTYAFSNNKSNKFYSPKLSKAYSLASLAADNIGIDASHCTILGIQHYTVSELLDHLKAGDLTPSQLWSPFDEPEYFDCEDYHRQYSRRNNYKELLASRVEKKKVYAEELINSIKKHIDSYNIPDTIICKCTNGMHAIVDPSKIAAIIPESDAQDMISAKLVIPNDTTININLQSFTKELTGFELPNFDLPISLVERSNGYTTQELQEAFNLSNEISEAYLGIFS